MGLIKLLSETLGVLSPAHISIFTMTSGGKKIGRDVMGNQYYEAAPRKGYKRPRRWVMYKNAPEASNIPPEWHGWIHHQTNVVPDSETNPFRQKWQKPHHPNLTGSKQAYRPEGHTLQGGKRAKANGDYEAWSPLK